MKEKSIATYKLLVGTILHTIQVSLFHKLAVILMRKIKKVINMLRKAV